MVLIARDQFSASCGPGADWMTAGSPACAGPTPTNQWIPT